MNRIVISHSVVTLAMLTIMALASIAPTSAQLDSEYAGNSGRFRQSVNGLSVFTEILKSNGCNVRTYPSLYDAADSADLVVWAPDRFNAPSSDEFDLLTERYRNNDWQTILFIGRDYNAAIAYWEKVFDMLPEEDKEAAEFQLELEKMKLENARGGGNFIIRNELYRYRVRDRWQSAKHVSGELADGIDGPNTDLKLTGRAMLSGQERNNFSIETLLEVDGDPFVFKMTQYDEPGLEIVVVTNGSLLFNLPLVNQENRKLVQNLIDYLDPYDVVILASGQDDISQGQDDPEQSNIWQWMSVGPFRWILPHMIMFGLLYCFCYFPIFGRARKLPPANVSNFSVHIQAVGKLLERTGDKRYAREAIDDYQKLVGHQSHQRKTS